MPGSSATTTTKPPLAPVSAALMNGSAATLRPTCFIETSARLAGEGDAQGLLEGGLLVDRPGRVNVRACRPSPDQIFHDLRSRRPGIGIAGRQPGVDGAEGHGLVAEQDLFGHACVLCRGAAPGGRHVAAGRKSPG